MPRFQLDPAKTALLVIDMQIDFVDPAGKMFVPQAYEQLPVTRRLIDHCRRLGVVVVFTQQVYTDAKDQELVRQFWPAMQAGDCLIDGTPGVAVHPSLDPLPEDLVVKKHRYSAFFRTRLDEELRAGSIDTLIVVGTNTDVCCESTVRDAAFRDYRVLMVRDANSTFDHADVGFGPLSARQVNEATFTVLGACAAQIVASDEILSGALLAGGVGR